MTPAPELHQASSSDTAKSSDKAISFDKADLDKDNFDKPQGANCTNDTRAGFAHGEI